VTQKGSYNLEYLQQTICKYAMQGNDVAAYITVTKAAAASVQFNSV